MELGIQVGGVLLALMFLVFLILGHKSWKWFHLLMMFFVMAGVITFCIYAAMVDKTRREWAKLYKEQKTQADKLAEEAFELKHGDPTGKSQEPGLTEIRGELARATLGLSNVYRNCSADPGFDGTSEVVVTIPKPAESEPPPAIPGEEPEPAPAAPTQAHNMVVDSTVYVFLEGPPTATGAKYPIEYIGEFHVTAVTDDSVTLRPTLPPYKPSAGGGTWAIYEEIPVDRQNYVDDLRDPDVIGQLFSSAGINLDETVAPEENKRLLQMSLIFPANKVGMAPDSQEYKDFIDRFRFDGMALNEINNIRKKEGSPDFDPPSVEQWRRIEFVEPEGGAAEATEIEVDSPDIEIVAVNWRDVPLSLQTEFDKFDAATKTRLSAQKDALEASANNLADQLKGLRDLARKGGITSMAALREASSEELRQYTTDASQFYDNLASFLESGLGSKDAADDALASIIAINTQLPELFDGRGRAIHYSLRKGSPVEISLEERDELRRGEIWGGVFDDIRVEAYDTNQRELPGTAERFIDAGQAKPISRIYKRKLNDFRDHFREIHYLTGLMQAEMNQLNVEIARMKATKQSFDEQYTLREDEQRKLNEDIDNFTEQKNKAEAYAKELEDKLAAKQASIDSLLADISKYQAELLVLHQKMEEAVRRNAQAISTGTP